MSSFSFIHAADLHLGSPFQGLALKDPEIAAIFAEASRKAFSTLVSQAIERRVDFLIIAGDVYDGDWKDNKIGLFFNREVARLDRAGIPVFLLRGNHDAESVITRTISLPANVHEFPTARPGSFRLDQVRVALHGQGFADRSASDNLVLNYPPPEPGWFNIGVLHTSLTGREPHAPYAPCSLSDLKSRGYDYWALGHVHEFEVVASDPPVIFPGNLQGRSIRERGAKGAVLVTVDDGVLAYERMIVDEARFGQVDIVLAENDDLTALLGKVEEAVTPICEAMEGKPLALRVRLGGATRFYGDLIARKQDVRDEIQAACHRCHEDIWLEKLDLALQPVNAGEAKGELSGLDLSALLGKDLPSQTLIQEAAARISEISVRLPGGAGAGDQPLDVATEELLAEARQLLLARAGRSE